MPDNRSAAAGTSQEPNSTRDGLLIAPWHSTYVLERIMGSDGQMRVASNTGHQLQATYLARLFSAPYPSFPN